MMAVDKPLTSLAQAFQGLTEEISSNEDMHLASFVLACDCVSALIGCAGIEFKLAQLELDAKINDLREASNSTSTIASLLDHDIGQNCVRQAGSHSRNLLRVMRGLQVVQEFFGLILTSEDNNLDDLAFIAYTRIFGDQHHEAIQTAVALALQSLPTKEDAWNKINEDEASGTVQLQTFVDACTTVTSYITEQFECKGLGIDW